MTRAEEPAAEDAAPEEADAPQEAVEEEQPAEEPAADVEMEAEQEAAEGDAAEVPMEEDPPTEDVVPEDDGEEAVEERRPKKASSGKGSKASAPAKGSKSGGASKGKKAVEATEVSLEPVRAGPTTNPSGALKPLLPARTGSFALETRDGEDRVYFLIAQATDQGHDLRYIYTTDVERLPDTPNNAEFGVSGYLSAVTSAPVLSAGLLLALSQSSRGRARRQCLPPLAIADLVVRDGTVTVPPRLLAAWRHINLTPAKDVGKKKPFDLELHVILSEGDWTTTVAIGNNLPLEPREAVYTLSGSASYSASFHCDTYKLGAQAKGRAVFAWVPARTPFAVTALDTDTAPLALENAEQLEFEVVDSEGNAVEPAAAAAPEPSLEDAEAEPSNVAAMETTAAEEAEAQEEEEAAAAPEAVPTPEPEFDEADIEAAIAATTEERDDAPAEAPLPTPPPSQTVLPPKSAAPVPVPTPAPKPVVPDPEPVPVPVQAPLRAVDGPTALQAMCVKMLPMMETRRVGVLMSFAYAADADASVAMAERHARLVEASHPKNQSLRHVGHEVVDLHGFGTVLVDSAEWEISKKNSTEMTQCFSLVFSYQAEGTHRALVVTNMCLNPDKMMPTYGFLNPTRHDHIVVNEDALKKSECSALLECVVKNTFTRSA